MYDTYEIPFNNHEDVYGVFVLMETLIFPISSSLATQHCRPLYTKYEVMNKIYNNIHIIKRRIM